MGVWRKIFNNRSVIRGIRTAGWFIYGSGHESERKNLLRRNPIAGYLSNQKLFRSRGWLVVRRLRRVIRGDSGPRTGQRLLPIRQDCYDELRQRFGGAL